MSGALRRGLAVAVLAYTAAVLMRPLNALVQLDPATVNPPGDAGQLVAAVRFVYYVLVPALYALSGLMLFAGKRYVRWLFALPFVLEMLVCAAYLYIASEIDMLGFEWASHGWVLGAYFLMPLLLLTTVFAGTRGVAGKPDP